jgi:hypothetical protein
MGNLRSGQIPKVSNSRRHPDPQNWRYKLVRPSGPFGVWISLVAAFLIVMSVNSLAFVYSRNHPANYGTLGLTVAEWRGLDKLIKPVDTLLLGDSACFGDLDSGAISDRLGGSVINLGNTLGSSTLMDAWMLSEYVTKFGPPRNVVFLRTYPGSYNEPRNFEFMANVPRAWGYWDDLGLDPVWKPGDQPKLFVKTFGVLYSNSDIFRDLALFPWKKHPCYPPVGPTRDYNMGYSQIQETMVLGDRKPDLYFEKFAPSDDNTRALRFISDLAISRHFQLYFLLQPEWDEVWSAGLRSETVNSTIEYLSQFIDPTYVHIVRTQPIAFPQDQMQNPNHLRPGADHVFTETNLDDIISIQNQLTLSQYVHLDLDSLVMDKKVYQTGDQPVISLTVSHDVGNEMSGSALSASCLVYSDGQEKGEWIARAPAVTVVPGATANSELKLDVRIGELDKPGNNNLVIFLRQEVGKLSHETRFDLPEKIVVRE